MPPRLSMAVVALAYGGLTVLAFLLGWWRGEPLIFLTPSPHHPIPPSPLPLPLAALAGLALGLMVVALSRLMEARLPWARWLKGEFARLLGHLSTREVLVVALFSAVGEEFFFRGVLLPATGLIVSSFIFGALHVGPSLRYLPWTAMAFALGLVFGGLTIYSGNLLAAVIAHLTINFLNLRRICVKLEEG